MYLVRNDELGKSKGFSLCIDKHTVYIHIFFTGDSIQALAALLAAKYRGYFVYPRPDKMTLEGQLSGNDLVKSRMADLTNYLNHLAAHPHIGTREVRG